MHFVDGQKQGVFVGSIVLIRLVKFRDTRLNNSGEIQPKAIGCSIFFRFSNFDNCRSKIAGDLISGEALGYVSLDVRAKFGDSRLNSGRIIRRFRRPDPLYALFTVFSCIFQPTGRSQ